MNTFLAAAKKLMVKFPPRKSPTVFTNEVTDVMHAVLILLEKHLLSWFQTRINDAYPQVNPDVIDSQMLKDNFVIWIMDVLVNSPSIQQKELVCLPHKYLTVLFLTKIMKPVCNASDMAEYINIMGHMKLPFLEIRINQLPLEVVLMIMDYHQIVKAVWIILLTAILIV